MTAVEKMFLAGMLVMTLCLTGCSDKGIKVAAQTIASVASANDTLAKTIISEEQAGVISEADARKLLNGVCDPVAKAIVITADATIQYTAFPPEARGKIGPLLQPLLDATQTALDSGLLGIKNAQVQTNIRTTLTVIRAGIATAQAALGQ